MDSQNQRSTSPLPSARSLLQCQPSDVSLDCQRPLPSLRPLPPKPNDNGDKSLLVFIQPKPDMATFLHTSKKRRTRDYDEHRTSSEERETPCSRKRSNSTSRKPTYLVRKEEKNKLTVQIDKLKAQLDYLKHATVMKPPCYARALVRQTDHKFFEMEMHNHLLREAVRNQHFQLFSVQSALSELTYSIQQNQCPINTYIHLGCDISQRRLVLEAMKAQKLRDAKQLIEKRMEFLNDSAELRRETSQFPTESGALSSIVFDVTPLDGGVDMEDITRAYNAASEYTRGIGTMMPPYTGDDIGVMHARMQVDTAPELPTETSFVMFTELKMPQQVSVQSESSERTSANQFEPLGLLVLDSVDEDELHPYTPGQFLREDVNAVISISKGLRRINPGCKSSEKRVPCLVLTRWILLTLRPNHEGVAPPAAMDFLLQTSINMGNEMLQAIHNAASSSSAAAISRRTTRQPRTLVYASAASNSSPDSSS